MSRILAVILFLFSTALYAQVSNGGLPFGFSIEPEMSVEPIFHLGQALITESQLDGNDPQPLQIAQGIEVDIDLTRDGAWQYTSNGLRFLSLAIQANNAKGLILYYRHFQIPEGGKLFLYSHDRSHLIGAFTSRNNPSGGYFATEMIHGDQLILEYDAPGDNASDPMIEIYQVHYVYEDVASILKGQSGACEVNVNCPEGQAWQNEKQSVAKIVLKAGFGTYLCTGSLLNNMRQDSIPYFLTARHCGASASLSDYSQWVFHFNYEAFGCDEPVEPPPSNTITGSSLLAEAPSGTTNGSDFKLLQLSTKLPDSYNPYFLGWNRDGVASQSGVGIHHPKGDIKKISTYTNALQSVLYGQTSPNPDGKYWKVVWAQTANGHGVTEGGSSGSAIFDNTGKIVGTLTGGAASCNELTAPDYYGKFSYHWASNGSPADAQLQPYLDPDNTGAMSMEGFGFGNRLMANFIADTTVISIGGQVSFTDNSGGEPEAWNWTFFSGDPSLIYSQNPGKITYYDYGTYDVSLVVSSGELTDSLLRKNYIRVTPNIYPNPANDILTIDFGRRELDYIEIEIFDYQGRMVRNLINESASSGIWTISVRGVKAGTYILRIKTNIQEDHLPLVVY